MTERPQYGPHYWSTVIPVLRDMVRAQNLPSVSEIAQTSSDPFSVLVSTMISLRTKDDVTFAASNRLLDEARTPAAMVGLSEERIATLIYPAGFYRTKARHIREVARQLLDSHGGKVPPDIDQLTDLPGVGRKTANLVLNLGFNIPAICVDTHVHRISNRFGWVSTKTPDRTERELGEVLPVEHWIEINELLVAYGQRICTPVSPRCSECPFGPDAGGHVAKCGRVGVTKSR